MNRTVFFVIVALLSTSACYFYIPRITVYILVTLFFIAFIGSLFILFLRRKFKAGFSCDFIHHMNQSAVVTDRNGFIISYNSHAKADYSDMKKGFRLFNIDELDFFGPVYSELLRSKSQNVFLSKVNYPLGGHLSVINPASDILLILANKQNQALNSVGKDFIANASHELRTTITIIKGFAETVNDIPNISGSMLQSFMEKILRNCERMENLFKNLLTLADLDYSRQGTSQICNLNYLVQHCSGTIQKIYPNISIFNSIKDEYSYIQGDPGLLELAVMNLLENAVKYSSQPAKIRTFVHSHESKIILKIQDFGLGIAKKDLENIFDRFYTVNKSHSRKLGGAGLGLSIVKTIVSKHQARITVQSTLDSGSTFCIEFNSRDQDPQ